jgi:hypothetical protein
MGITGDVDHRVERPFDPVGTRLVGRHRLGGGHQRRIPARRLAQRHREHRPVAVDHIEAEDQGDVERRVLDRRGLYGIDVVDPGEIEHRTDLPRLGQWDQIAAVQLTRRRHLELAELLRHGHLAQEPIDVVVDLRRTERRSPAAVVIDAASMDPRVLDALALCRRTRRSREPAHR